MEILFQLYTVLKWLTIIVAIGFFLSAIDDVFVDLYYLIWQLYRRLFVMRHYKPLHEEDLRTVPEKSIAVLIPAWHEAEVIGRMLRHTIRSVDYANYEIFVGTYPNDEPTQEGVAEAFSEDPRIHRTICPHPGPTNKADCLNWAFQGIKLHEAKTGRRFEILLVHDAEDIIHPLSLKLINYLIPKKDMVQLPVFPLEMPLRDFTAGTYLDEFAESHTKDLLVRERVAKMIPGAGVGTAFSRATADDLATSNKNQLFNIETLTEDYDFGFRLKQLKKKAILVKFFIQRTRIVRHWWSKRERIKTVNEYVATREFFPVRFRDAVRQKSRWILGIVFQGWRQIGWTGQVGNRFMLYRDRKAIYSTVIPVLGYLLVPYWLLYFYYQYFGPSPNPLPPLVDSRWVWWLIVVDTIIMLERWLQKTVALHAIAGWNYTLVSFPRMVWCNIINFFSMALATRQFVESLVTGKTVPWMKTSHAFPTEAELLAYKQKLGDLLLENRLITLVQLSEALEAQKQSGEQLGEILVRLGHLEEDNLVPVLGGQLGVETCEIDPQKIAPSLLEMIPERIARRHSIIPMEGKDHQDLIIATTQPNDETLRRTLEKHTGRPITFILAGRQAIQFAINQAYLPVKRPRLGQLLLRAGVLTSKQLAHALAEQAKRPRKLGMVLQDLGYLSREILEERIREQARLRAPLWDQPRRGLE